MIVMACDCLKSVPRGQPECIWIGLFVNVARKCADSLNYVAALTVGCLLRQIPCQRGNPRRVIEDIPFFIFGLATIFA